VGPWPGSCPRSSACCWACARSGSWAQAAWPGGSTTQRHGGEIDLGTWGYRSTGYAVVSSTADLYGATGGLPAPRSLLGTVRISVTPAPRAGPAFAGIAPAGAASHYLAGVGYDTVRGITHYHPVYTGHTGGTPATAPARAGIWAARAADPGTQTLTWPTRRRGADGASQAAAVEDYLLQGQVVAMSVVPELTGRGPL
jgi:hypothetical protein